MRDALPAKIPRMKGIAVLAAIVGSGCALAGAVKVASGPTSSATAIDAASPIASSVDSLPPPAVVDAATVRELYEPVFVLDASGLSMNGAYVEGTREIPRDAFAPPEPVVKKLHAIADAMVALSERGRRYATLGIAPDVPAPLAGSVLTAIAAMYPTTRVTVGTTTFEWTYLPDARIPRDVFFYLTPASSGFAVERQTIVRDLRTNGPPCRVRGGRKVVSSRGELGRAAASLCGGSAVECAEHVEVTLPVGRTFGELAPWIDASFELLSFSYARFVAEGAVPMAEAVECEGGVR